MGEMILSFSALTPRQQSIAGGKGGTLARLYQAGYPVPDGFVLLPDAFVADELLPEAWAQVQAHLAQLRGDDAHTFAVRSSALAEDSAHASFAGEFETVLDVRTDDEVRSAIRRVRRSRHSERVRVYSQTQGLETEQEMGVVVQRLVRAEISGILFTADPVTGGRERMVGNFVHGLGEGLVSGQVEPREFALLRPRGRYEGAPELKHFARPLFKLAKRLERELGGPQDIEWAIAPGKLLGFNRDNLYLLQSRPITTLLGFNPKTGEFNDTHTGEYVWSSVNLGEAVSVVMTPLTWSIMYTGFREVDILPGYPSIGNVAGRLYQNVTVMDSVLRALGKKSKI